MFSDNDAFFAWTFEKRHPLWQTLLSFSWPVFTLAICLFPVYPHSCKLIILYTCASLLLLILCLLTSTLSRYLISLQIFPYYCISSSLFDRKPIFSILYMLLGFCDTFILIQGNIFCAWIQSCFTLLGRGKTNFAKNSLCT